MQILSLARELRVDLFKKLLNLYAFAIQKVIQK